MPKLLSRPPKLAKNGNYAYVNHANKRIPVGRWGSSEAEHNYRVFCASWTPEDPLNLALPGRPITVEKFTELFLANIEHTKSKKTMLYYRAVSEALTTLYANISVEKFGLQELSIVQKYIWDLPRKYATSHVNKLMELAWEMFYWGYSRDLVPESVIDDLRKIKPVNIHRGTYKATKKKILNVPDDETLERMSPYLPPTIIAMIKIQKITGMQVKEILQMRIGDLDRSEKIWIYRPGISTDEWNNPQIIELDDVEQSLIQPRIESGLPEEYVFRPLDTIQDKRDKETLTRKARILPPQKTRREKHKNKPERHINCYYTTSAYNHNISRTIESANRHLDDKIPHWTPYQLRHTAVTRVTVEEGLDAACLCGPKNNQCHSDV